MSATEYLALGETSDRYELVDGVIFMSPSPFPPHNEESFEVLGQLHAFSRQSRSVRVFAETDVVFSRALVYHPDIVVYRTDRLRRGRLSRLDTPPDMVIEILSASMKPYDLITKRGDYQRYGVGEYWAIDPDDCKVRCWRREPGDPGVFAESTGAGSTMPSAAVPGFCLDLVALRQVGQADAD